MYGIRWSEFNRNDQLVYREKDFKTSKAREKFIAKLEQRSNFNSIEAWSEPSE